MKRTPLKRISDEQIMRRMRLAEIKMDLIVAQVNARDPEDTDMNSECERCGTRGPVDMHHVRASGKYGHRIADEGPFELLCRACHRKETE